MSSVRGCGPATPMALLSAASRTAMATRSARFGVVRPCVMTIVTPSSSTVARSAALSAGRCCPKRRSVPSPYGGCQRRAFAVEITGVDDVVGDFDAFPERRGNLMSRGTGCAIADESDLHRCITSAFEKELLPRKRVPTGRPAILRTQTRLATRPAVRPAGRCRC